MAFRKLIFYSLRKNIKANIETKDPANTLIKSEIPKKSKINCIRNEEN